MAKNNGSDSIFNKNDYSLAVFSKTVVNLPRPVNDHHGMATSAVVPPSNVLLFPGGKWLGWGEKPIDQSRKQTIASGNSHGRYMLIVPLLGEGAIILDNEVFQLKYGQTILVHPYQFHRYFSSSPVEKTWLFITFEHMGSEDLGVFRHQLCPISDFQLHCCEQLVTEFRNSNSKGVSLLLTYLLSGLLQNLHCSKTNDHIDMPKPQGFINQIVEHVNARMKDALQVSDIAKFMSLSPSRLRTKFREATGVSLGKYVRELRLHKAAISLSDSTQSIHSISESVGYESLFSFSRAFKMEYGMSPSQYRQNMSS